MSKTIVVPIDFSEASLNAYLYATKIAPVLRAKVELVHINESPFPELEESDTSAENAELKKHLLTFSRVYPQQIDRNTLVKIDIEVTILSGSATEILLDYSKKTTTGLIIMGATGSHAAVNRLIGDVTLSISQEASCPVMLVPEHAKTRVFERILYASDYESVDEVVIDQIVCFSRQFYADLNFIQIGEKTEAKDYNQIKKHLFQKLPYSKRKPSFKIASGKNDSTLKDIENYAQAKDLDLIVMVNQQRSYLDAIFKKRLTHHIVERLDMPLLIFHPTNHSNTCRPKYEHMLN